MAEDSHPPGKRTKNSQHYLTPFPRPGRATAENSNWKVIDPIKVARIEDMTAELMQVIRGVLWIEMMILTCLLVVLFTS